MQSQPYVKRPKVSRAKISGPTSASSPSSPPFETAPAPTDLVTIMGGARLYEDLGESQVRAWCNRGLLNFYANPDPRAGRRPGRGRPVKRWVSVSELAVFVAARKKGARAQGVAPTADGQLGSHSEAEGPEILRAPGGRRHGTR